MVYHNLEYGDTKSGQLRYWLVNKIFFICMQSKKFKKELMLKFKMIFRTCLNFMIAFIVYEYRAYIDVRYGDTYPEKTD